MSFGVSHLPSLDVRQKADPTSWYEEKVGGTRKRASIIFGMSWKNNVYNASTNEFCIRLTCKRDVRFSLTVIGRALLSLQSIAIALDRLSYYTTYRQSRQVILLKCTRYDRRSSLGGGWQQGIPYFHIVFPSFLRSLFILENYHFFFTFGAGGNTQSEWTPIRS